MERDVVMAMPVQGMNVLHIVSDSVTRECEDCKQKVYCSPATIAMMQSRPVKLVCLPCGLDMAESEGQSYEIGVIPGQVEELIRDIASGPGRHN